MDVSPQDLKDTQLITLCPFGHHAKLVNSEMSTPGRSMWKVVALEAATVTTGGPRGTAAPHREQADGILDSVKTGGVATQRLAVTGPSGVEIELAVPRGATQQQIMSMYQAELILREVRRGSDLAPELAKRMDKAREEGLRKERSVEDLMKEWEDILEEVRGRDGLNEGEGRFVVLRAVRGLAKATEAAGHPDQAIPLWHEAVSIRESLNEENKTELIESMSDLATAYAKNKDLESCFVRHQAALDVAKQPNSGVEYTHLTALNKNCATAALRLEWFEEALPYLQEAYRRCHSSEHPHGPQCRFCPVCREHTQNLALCLHHMDRYEEAIPFLEEIIGIQTQVRDYESLVFNFEQLGDAYYKTGSHERALETFKLGLDLTRQLNRGPMDLGAATATVGKMLLTTEKFDEALPLLEESVPLLERAMGPAHPNVESVRQMLKRAKDGAEAQRQAGHSMQEGAGAEEEGKEPAEIVDYTRLSIRELKALLTSRGVSLAGLMERGDLVQACRESEDMDEGVE